MIRLRVDGWVIFAAVTLCIQNTWGQPSAALPEIRGVVLEIGVNQPIPGAEVTIILNQTQAVVERKMLSLPSKDGNLARAQEALKERLTRGRVEVGKVITDAQGTFHFQAPELGLYSLSVKKDGYERPDFAYSGSSPGYVALDANHPSRDLKIFLIRPAEVSGRVIDADSGEPLPEFPIVLRRYTYHLGVATSYAQNTVLTDSEGRLRTIIKNPARYIAIVEPRNVGKVQFLKEFSEEDAKTVDRDYETSHWPGGAGLETTYGVAIPSGGFFDLGTIRARQATTYRALVHVPAGGCRSDDAVKVEMLLGQSMSGFSGALGETRCGKDFLIRNLEPGAYPLKLSADSNRVKDILTLEIRDRNIEVTASLRRGVELEGQVILTEGARPLAMDRLEVTARSVGSFVEYSHSSSDAEGNFRFTNLPFGPRRLDLSGVDGNHYVKEVRQNEVSVFDNIFTVAGSGSLQVLIDDKPATITGVVSDGDRPLSEPYVVVSKWPTSAGSFRTPPNDTTGGNDGKFRFSGLAPGEYRILAVQKAYADKLDEPGVLDRLLANAEKIVLTPATSLNLSLKPTDATR